MNSEYSISKLLDYNTHLSNDDRCDIADLITSIQSIKLNDNIKEHHSNNQSDFARSQGVSQSQARRWLKRNCVVIDGAVYCQISKQTKKGDADD